MEEMKKYVGLLCVVLGLSAMLCACSKDGQDMDKNNTHTDEITTTVTGAKESENIETEKSEQNVTTEKEQSTVKVTDKQEAGDEPVSSEAVAEMPGSDVVNLVNLRGDETAAYKLADGTYMDQIDRKYTFNGTDAWFDEDGVEWNEKVD